MHPPATAGGTDCVQARAVTYRTITRRIACDSLRVTNDMAPAGVST